MIGGSEIGRRIGQLRRAQGSTLPELASAAGISKGYLWMLETHWSHRPVEAPPNPGLDLLVRIAEPLGITVADLLATDFEIAGEGNEKKALPVGLSEFLVRRAEEGQPVAGDAVEALATVKLRGRRPQTVEEWAAIYQVWEETLGSER